MGQNKSIKKYFDAIYCVNLKRRPERWVSFLDEIQKIGLEESDIIKIEACDGDDLFAPDDIHYEHRHTHGCRMSHMKILNDMIDKKYKKILVFEDDINIRGDVHLFMEHIPPQWDMLYFSFTENYAMNSFFSYENKYVFKIMACVNTHAYAINDRTAPDILDCISDPAVFDEITKYKHVDQLMCRYQRNHDMAIYAPTEEIIVQNKVFISDIKK